METTSYIALSRMTALKRQLDVIANNVANLTTPGFKAEATLFSEYMTPKKDGGYSFVQDVGTVRDLRPGHLVQTQNQLDVAVHGDGYFTVETPQGNQYTRSGSFALNEEGELVTAEGYKVLDDSGKPLQIPAEFERIAINKDGSVFDGINGSSTLGKIGLVTFDNEQALEAKGSGLFVTAQQPIPVENPAMAQGFIEQSNVESVVEMTRLIDVQRSYESAQKLMDTEHERIRQSIRRLTQVGN